MKRVTIKDLAKMLSLNISTVSRALSNHPDISEETKRRVQETAKEFNYVPNLHAKYFRNKSSDQVAIILPEFNMFFTPDLLRGISDVLEANSISLITFYSNNSKDKEAEYVKHCLSWVVDGVFVVLSDETDNLDHFAPLYETEIPVVLIDKVIPSKKYSTVTIDDEKTAYEATKTLLKKDKHNILGLFGNPNLNITKLRQSGFEKAHKEMNVRMEENQIIYMNKTLPSSILQKPFFPYDAVFCMTDEIMMAIFSFLRSRDLYPGKVSIVSISDGRIPNFIFPQITHMLHSGYEIGKTAAIHLLDRKKKPTTEIKNYKINTHLVNLYSVF